jgi:hypothetical protein
MLDNLFIFISMEIYYYNKNMNPKNLKMGVGKLEIKHCLNVSFQYSEHNNTIIYGR